MKLIKETILGVMITEMVDVTEISEKEFFSEYEILLKRYVDCTDLKTLLLYKQPLENWDIILQAKKLALGRTIEESKKRRYPLSCIFSRLTVDGKYPQSKYYKPASLSMENVMPVSEVKNTSFDDISSKLYKEMKELKKIPPKDFDSFMIIMDTLLKKYFWSIPASGRENEDISEYDYIKSAMAIASALTQSPDKDKPYMIVAGHFSGIQKYIFSASKVGTGGVAKRLRARSFYVNAMVSALAHFIIHNNQLPMTNILMLTGGKFYILLPHKDDTEKMLSDIEKQVTKFLYEKYKGNLTLELVWETFSEDELMDYSECVKILSEKINSKKKRLLESILIKENQWSTEKFIVYKDLANMSMCRSCRSALVDKTKEMCPNCEMDTEIGGMLPKIQQFSFSRKKGQYNLLGDYYLNLDIEKGGENNYLIMQLNNTELHNLYDKPVNIYYAVNHVPLKATGEIKTFTEIAEAAKGTKKLGILKADVDTLGFIFSEGLKSENDEMTSIARLSTLSRMLEQYFGGYLHELIDKKYQNIYCIFSGGDDLFFIGPWSDMPLLAIDINESFRKYIGQNKCMTLSAAICMANSGGHISTLAEDCERTLIRIKQSADKYISEEKNGRNGIGFLGKVMKWEDFKKQIDIGTKFSYAIKDVGTSMIRRLASYSKMYQEYLYTRNPESLVFLPLFSNDMTRNMRTLQKNRWLNGHYRDLYKKASDYQHLSKDFYYTEFCVNYALQLTKEERKNG